MLWCRAKHQHKGVLQKYAYTHCCYQKRNPSRIMHQKTLVCHPLDYHTDKSTQQDRSRNRNPKRQPQTCHNNIKRISAYHDNIAMGEVYQLDDTINHAVSQSNQRINASQPQTVYNMLQKIHRCTFQIRYSFRVISLRRFYESLLIILNNPKRG